MTIADQLNALRAELPDGVTLVAVSKMHPVEAVAEAYRAGQRIFGESRVQELCAKHDALPKDIRWQMIGHLQTNKVRAIAPFVDLIHSVDSERLLGAIDRAGSQSGRAIDVLLEVHLAKELTKSGFAPDELVETIDSGRLTEYNNVRVRGLMTVGSLSDDTDLTRSEFNALRALFDHYRPRLGAQFDTLSMGMTDDYRIAVECGSTMVRIGSLIFGARDYTK